MKYVLGKKYGLILNFFLKVLFVTDLWVFIYIGLLLHLNARFPPTVKEIFLTQPAVAENFEIPLYLIITFVFILVIFFLQKLLSKLEAIPLVFRFFLLSLLLLLFVSMLGTFPMGGQYDPYPARPDPTIYLTISFVFVVAVAFIIALGKYLKGKFLYVAVIFILALVTFDARFPMVSYDYEFFIGPSYEIAQGKTVYTDIISRYGFLQPIFFAILNKTVAFSFSNIPFILWFLYITQYFLCFLLIKKFSKSDVFSLLGTLAIMTFNYFSLVHLPAAIPEIGPLRWLPMIVLIYLFYRFKKLDSPLFIVLTTLLSLLMVDSGVAIMMAYITTLFLFVINRNLSLNKALQSILILLVSLFSILLFVNVAHLLLGYKSVDLLSIFSSLRNHAISGLAMMPIPNRSFFWFVLLIYFASIIYFLRKTKTGIELLDKVLLFSANISLFASVYFVGRSHPHNLFNIALLVLLTLFLLIGLVYKNIQSAKVKLSILVVVLLLFIAYPAFERRITLTEMLLTKYSRLVGGNIFTPELDELITAKYKEDIELIKKSLPDDQTVILSTDDTYLFYVTGKKNLLDANPILGIDTMADIEFAIKKVIKTCPQKIAIDCSFIGKCSPYTPFVGANFDVRLILKRIEEECKVMYKPITCTSHFCISDAE